MVRHRVHHNADTHRCPGQYQYQCQCPTTPRHTDCPLEWPLTNKQARKRQGTGHWVHKHGTQTRHPIVVNETPLLDIASLLRIVYHWGNTLKGVLGGPKIGGGILVLLLRNEGKFRKKVPCFYFLVGSGWSLLFLDTFFSCERRQS